MATLRPDLVVSLRPTTSLTSPPTGTGTLVIAVHGAALKARGDRLTQVVEFALDGGVVRWAGALDERDLVAVPEAEKHPGARTALATLLFRGPRCFQVITPGTLQTAPPPERSRDAMWSEASPWLVVGDDPTAGLLAMPIGTNPAARESRWAPAIPSTNLPEQVTQRGAGGGPLLESNHLWTFDPAKIQADSVIGELAKPARKALTRAVSGYWR